MQEAKQYYFTNGSAAVAPIEVEYETAQQRRAREQKEKEYQERKRRRAQQIDIHGSRVSAVYTILLVMLISVMAFGLIYLQTNIQSSMKHISALEAELSEIKLNNDAAESRISTSTNLTYVRNVATEQMGMHYASNDQIRYYETGGKDYMVVYEQVP